MMRATFPRSRRPAKHGGDNTACPVGEASEFTDPESQRVLRAAAHAVLWELGLEAGREYFNELLAGQRKKGISE